MGSTAFAERECTDCPGEAAESSCVKDSMQDGETLVKWEPVEGISFDFISAELFSWHMSLWVRLIDGRAEVLEHRDLVFEFKSVAAFTLYEEFVHPTQGTVWGREPVISADCNATWPCIIVSESAWIRALGDEIEISHKGAVHYRLCSGFPVIDVVAAEVPIVTWLSRPKYGHRIARPEWVSLADDAC